MHFHVSAAASGIMNSLPLDPLTVVLVEIESHTHSGEFSLLLQMRTLAILKGDCKTATAYFRLAFEFKHLVFLGN